MKKSTPFTTIPSPARLYLTPGLKSAIHKTKFVIDHRQGLTCLLGDVGMGKSSLLRLIYGDYAAMDDVTTAFIPQPEYKTEFAFVQAVAAQFGLPPRRSLYDQARHLEEFLLTEHEADRNVVVFLDEGQRLKPALLEQVRALLNYETNEEKLIQMVLAGQLELRDRLLRDEQKAIASRVFAPSLLEPLSPQEVAGMLRYRCEMAGVADPFPAATLHRIYELTAGIPREVLKLCAIGYDMMLMTSANEMTVELLEFARAETVMRREAAAV